MYVPSHLQNAASLVLTVSSADSDSQTASGCLSSWHCVEYVVPSPSSSSSSSPVTVYSTLIISWAQTEHNLQSLHFDKLCCAELCSGASRIFAENYAARGAKQVNSCNILQYPAMKMGSLEVGTLVANPTCSWRSVLHASRKYHDMFFFVCLNVRWV